MKKILLMAAMVLSGMVASAQTNQVVWLNGRAVLGQSITQVDSLKFGEMTESDTLYLLLPRTMYIHDTVFVPYQVEVHDTIYINRCDTTEQDTTQGHAPKGVEMVDLGLSVKWANMNVGATKVEEYGDYFAWGETSPKSEYNWGIYKWMASGQSSLDYINKYTFADGQTSASWYSGSTFIGDNKTTLEKSDDAASVNWGGNWRMPTHAEQEELVNNCTITWISDYQGTGVAGRIFTSNKTGYTDKSIFLPAAGFRLDARLRSAGSRGYYWSSSLLEGSSNNAWRLYFDSDNVGADFDSRVCGFSVRPVCQ